MQNENNDLPTSFDLQLLMAETICAIEHLHEAGYMYRDIKMDNILLDSNGHILLADFGLAIKLVGNAKTNEYYGTPGFMAPEVFHKKNYSFPADFWSVGIAFLEMAHYGAYFMGNDSKITDFYEKKPTLRKNKLGILLKKAES